MYKVIHVHHEEQLEEELNEAFEEGYLLDSFQAYEGPDEFHYVAILALYEKIEEEQ